MTERCPHSRPRSTNLANGYYSMNVETSLSTDLPSLLSLTGADVYNQSNVPYLAVSATGMSSEEGAGEPCLAVPAAGMSTEEERVSLQCQPAAQHWFWLSIRPAGRG